MLTDSVTRENSNVKSACTRLVSVGVGGCAGTNVLDMVGDGGAVVDVVVDWCINALLAPSDSRTSDL